MEIPSWAWTSLVSLGELRYQCSVAGIHRINRQILQLVVEDVVADFENRREPIG